MEFRDKSILVVEDNKTLRDLILIMLKKMKFANIEGANNGSMALHKLIYTNYDLIITDLEMPVMDGLKMIDIIRKNSKLSNLPIIVITTNSSEENVLTAKSLQVNGFIVKPLSVKKLTTAIARVLSKS